jgi:hypothetical protein
MNARIANTIPRKTPFQRAEDGNLERAEQDACGGRQADVAVRQEEHDHRHQRDPDPPLAGVVPARLAPHHLAHRPAELEVEERSDERLEQNEQPGDDEPRPRAERTSGVCVETARGRLEARELADRRGGAEAGDEREQHRQRQRLP